MGDVVRVGGDERRFLPRAGILSRLTPQERGHLAEKCLWRRFVPGEEILRDQDRSRDVHFITRGRVRICVYTARGKEVIFRDCGPGEMVGVLSAIDSRPRPATIVALQTSLIASLKSEDFSLMVHRSPIFCDAVLEHLASVVRSLNNRVVEHATLKVSYRIRRELLRIAREGGSLQPTARLPRITHAELASRVGTHREAVTREINHLVATNVVLREGRELVVKDLVALHKAAKSSRTRSH